MNSYHDIDVPLKDVLTTIEDAENRVAGILASVKSLRTPLDEAERALEEAAFSLKSAWFDYHGRI